jgi:hypothetical protein
MELELLQNIMDMVLHRLDLNLQTDGDLFITAFFLDQPQDLAFPRGEMRQAEELHLRPCVGTPLNLREEQRDDSRGTGGLTCDHSPNALKQLLQRRFALEQPRSSCFNTRQNVGFRFSQPHHEKLGCRAGFVELTSFVKAVSPLLGKIEDHDIWAQLINFRDDHADLGKASDHGDVLLLGQYMGKSLAKETIAMDDRYPDSVLHGSSFPTFAYSRIRDERGFSLG